VRAVFPLFLLVMHTRPEASILTKLSWHVSIYLVCTACSGLAWAPDFLRDINRCHGKAHACSLDFDLLDALTGWLLCRTSCSRDQRSCWQEFAGNTMTQYDTDGESNIFHLLILFSLLFLHRLMLALYNNVWLDIIGLTVAYHVVVLHP
jgi:hypothetical protein